MGKKLIKDSTLTGIADAIRAKGGATGPMTPQEMPSKITAIPTVGGLTVTNTATVGQTIRVSAVDENGQPTEWEAVEFPAGGGGGGWEVITNIEMIEDGDSTAQMFINVNDAGEKFAYREIMVTMFGTIIGGLQADTNKYVFAKPYPNDNGTGYLPYDGLQMSRLGAGGQNKTYKMHYSLFRNFAILNYVPLESNLKMYNGGLIEGDYLVRSIKLFGSGKDAVGNDVDFYCPFAAGGRITIYGRN